LASISDRFKNAWNALVDKQDNYSRNLNNYGAGSYYRPDRAMVISGSERTIMTSITNRISVDVSLTKFEHCRVDDNNNFSESIDSTLNECLKLEANKDQTSQQFMIDLISSMLEEGVVAVVPIDTSCSIINNNSFDIYSMRVAKIIEWYPDNIKVNVYNDRTGNKEDIILPKRSVAIIENPFYQVMNSPNSTLKRLTYKLSLLDQSDAKNNSSKLDMIIKLPYTIKSDSQKERAQERKANIEDQLNNSKYGIAYIDATEQIIQLNRPIENALLPQIESLTKTLYDQLSMDATILNGTATADTMTNYYNRVVTPIINAVTLEFTRKFLTRTARSQKQAIMAFQKPFSYLTVTQIAGLVDSLSRNEVLTGNEFRQALGFKPSSEPSADELRNKNLIDMSQVQNGGDPQYYQDQQYPDQQYYPEEEQDYGYSPRQY
jgi:phage portal protein